MTPRLDGRRPAVYLSGMSETDQARGAGSSAKGEPDSQGVQRLDPHGVLDTAAPDHPSAGEPAPRGIDISFTMSLDKAGRDMFDSILERARRSRERRPHTVYAVDAAGNRYPVRRVRVEDGRIVAMVRPWSKRELKLQARERRRAERNSWTLDEVAGLGSPARVARAMAIVNKRFGTSAKAAEARRRRTRRALGIVDRRAQRFARRAFRTQGFQRDASFIRRTLRDDAIAWLKAGAMDLKQPIVLIDAPREVHDGRTRLRFLDVDRVVVQVQRPAKVEDIKIDSVIGLDDVVIVESAPPPFIKPPACASCGDVGEIHAPDPAYGWRYCTCAAGVLARAEDGK